MPLSKHNIQYNPHYSSGTRINRDLYIVEYRSSPGSLLYCLDNRYLILHQWAIITDYHKAVSTTHEGEMGARAPSIPLKALKERWSAPSYSHTILGVIHKKEPGESKAICVLSVRNRDFSCGLCGKNNIFWDSDAAKSSSPRLNMGSPSRSLMPMMHSLYETFK